MPRKPKPSSPRRRWRRFPLRFLINLFAKDRSTPDEPEAAVRRFKKAVIERALGGELAHHLGYPPGSRAAPTDILHFPARVVVTDADGRPHPP